MTKAELSDIYRDYSACLNKQGLAESGAVRS
jgi:hypothetical protein